MNVTFSVKCVTVAVLSVCSGSTMRCGGLWLEAIRVAYERVNVGVHSLCITGDDDVDDRWRERKSLQAWLAIEK